MRVQVFPVPSIILENGVIGIEGRNIIDAEEVALHMSLDGKPKGIELKRANFVLEDILTYLEDLKGSFLEYIISSDSTITIKARMGGIQKRIEHVNLDIESISQGGYRVGAELAYRNHKYVLDMLLRSFEKFYVVECTLSNDMMEFSYQGSIQKDNLLTPKGRGKILLNGGNDVLVFDIKTEDGFMHISDITSSGSNIIGVSSDVRLYEDESKASVFELSFNNINLDTLGLSATDYSMSDFLSNVLGDFESAFVEKVNTFFKIKVGELILDGKKFTRVNLDIDAVGDNILLREISAKSGEDFIKVTGVMEHNNIRPKVVGDIQIKVNDLSQYVDTSISSPLLMKSDFTLLPNKLYFNHIKSKVNDKTVRGKGYLKRTLGGRFEHNWDLYMNTYDLNNSDIKNQMRELILTLWKYDFDKTGTKLKQYIKEKHQELNCIGNIGIRVNQLKVFDEKFNNFHVNFRIGEDDIGIDNINFESKAIKGVMMFSVSPIRDLLKLSVKLDALDCSRFKSFLPTSVTQIVDKRKITVHKPFNFFSIPRFNGDIEISLKDVKCIHDNFDSIQLKCNIENGDLIIEECNIKKEKGELKVGGVLKIGDIIPSYELVLRGEKLNIKSFLSPFFKQKVFYGTMDIDGMVKAKGRNMFELLRNLNGKTVLSSDSLFWNGGDLNKAVEKPKKKFIDYYLKYGKTKINKLSGEVFFNKGFANLSNLDFATNRVSGRLTAKVDLVSQYSSASAKFALQTLDRGNRKETKYFGVSGNGQFDKFNYKIDYGGLIQKTPP